MTHVDWTQDLTDNYLNHAFPRSEFSAEQSEHLRAVGDILESYLRSICDLHSGQKAVRLEREIQFQNMSRLEINAAKNSGEDG